MATIDWAFLVLIGIKGEVRHTLPLKAPEALQICSDCRLLQASSIRTRGIDWGLRVRCSSTLRLSEATLSTPQDTRRKQPRFRASQAQDSASATESAFPWGHPALVPSAVLVPVHPSAKSFCGSNTENSLGPPVERVE